MYGKNETGYDRDVYNFLNFPGPTVDKFTLWIEKVINSVPFQLLDQRGQNFV